MSENETEQDVASLKTVLVTGYVTRDDVESYLEKWMANDDTEEDGDDEREVSVDELGSWTYVAEFKGDIDIEDLVIEDTHTIETKGGQRPVFLFLYNEESRAVYSAYDELNWEEEEDDEEGTVQLPSVDHQKPDTLLVTKIKYDSDTDSKSIEDHFDGLSAVKGEVTKVVCVESAGIAFVQFENDQDAKTLARRATTKLENGTGKTTTVQLFLYCGALVGQDEDTDSDDDNEEDEEEDEETATSARKPKAEAGSRAEAGTKAGAASQNFDVMISYQWDHQDFVKKIRDGLKARNFRVWMDLDHMSGCILDAMARGVKGSKAVLPCVSSGYEKSDNCKKELKYANKLKKIIVPLMVEEDYNGDGWLDLLIEDRLYIDFRKDSFNKQIEKLVQELKNQGVTP